MEEQIKKLEEKNAELRAENAELKKFVNYVRQLKTHADFNRLRNIILATNKQFKRLGYEFKRR